MADTPLSRPGLFASVSLLVFGLAASIDADEPSDDRKAASASVAAAGKASATQETSAKDAVSATIEPDQNADPVIDGHPLSDWIEQLSSNAYSSRERASVILADNGDEAISALVRATESGDFEVVSRIVRILGLIASRQPAETDGGAFDALMALAENATGARGLAARRAIRSVRQRRERDARERLAEAGVFCGNGVVQPALSVAMVPLIRINRDWNGDLESLQHLRWVRDVAVVILEGPGCTGEVLQSVCEVPGLSRIHLRHGKLDHDDLEPLTKLDKIVELAINYVDLSGPAEDTLVRLSVVQALVLRGTGLRPDAIEKIRTAFPAVAVEINEGGFLGVRADLRQTATIQSVIQGGAADRAGLRARDTITEVNGKPISSFAELKEVISRHKPKESLHIKLQRSVDGEMKELTFDVELQEVRFQ